MAYQIYQIVEGKGPPVSVTKNDSVSTALSLMIEHDYSQLPVVSREDKAKDMVVETAEGMITNESVLRGIRNFKTNIDSAAKRVVHPPQKADSLI
jgi:CBS domain-containing protein